MRSGGPWPSPVRLVADRLEVYGERWVPAEPSVEPGSEERDCATAVRPPRPEADQAVRTSKRSPRQRPAPRGRSKANRRTCAAPSGGPPGREDIKTRACITTGIDTTIQASAATRKQIRWGLWMDRVSMGMHGTIRIGTLIAMGVTRSRSAEISANWVELSPQFPEELPSGAV